jgi:hypothetical protein
MKPKGDGDGRYEIEKSTNFYDGCMRFMSYPKAINILANKTVSCCILDSARRVGAKSTPQPKQVRLLLAALS